MGAAPLGRPPLALEHLEHGDLLRRQRIALDRLQMRGLRQPIVRGGHVTGSRIMLHLGHGATVSRCVGEGDGARTKRADCGGPDPTACGTRCHFTAAVTAKSGLQGKRVKSGQWRRFGVSRAGIACLTARRRGRPQLARPRGRPYGDRPGGLRAGSPPSPPPRSIRPTVRRLPRSQRLSGPGPIEAGGRPAPATHRRIGAGLRSCSIRQRPMPVP